MIETDRLVLRSFREGDADLEAVNWFDTSRIYYNKY